MLNSHNQSTGLTDDVFADYPKLPKRRKVFDKPKSFRHNSFDAFYHSLSKANKKAFDKHNTELYLKEKRLIADHTPLRVPMPVPEPQLHPPEYYGNSHILSDFSSIGSQRRAPRYNANGNRVAVVSVSVSVKNHNGEFKQLERYSVEGTYSPLGTVQAVEGKFFQVRRVGGGMKE